MRRFLLHEQRIKHENSLLNYLRIFCMTALRGVLSFYNGQTQAEGYQRYGQDKVVDSTPDNPH